VIGSDGGLDLTRLIEGLSRGEAYPHPVPGDVVVHQTHISVVFLAGPYAYKVKKPVDLGFLDFTTLERRRHFCEEEVRLNRRLARDVYLGVVPISVEDGSIRVAGSGAPSEYAVRMRRLPAEATLERRLHNEEPLADVLEKLGRMIATFHAGAEAGPGVSRYGSWEVVAGNARENLLQSKRHTGVTLSAAVFERLAVLLEERLEELRTLIESRAREHVPRDSHGDLHLDHVYVFPDREPPDDLVVVDCIEFNERFRYADPVSDVAFLAMDLAYHGRRDLVQVWVDSYFAFADDAPGRRLLPFYRSYRAAVRAKVDGMLAEEPEVSAEERDAAVQRARGHWLMALAELEQPARRPCLVLVAGLPGTGKSTVARGLAEAAGFHVIRADAVRKGLAGLPPDAPAAAGLDEGIYTPAWTERTYTACLDQAEEVLFQGGRVVVDATFWQEARRRTFLDAGTHWGIRTLLLELVAEPELVKARMLTRTSGPSDADWSIYQRLAERWEEPAAATERIRTAVDAAGQPPGVLADALAVLRAADLVD
jgi:aminoglycoside phosphotransferase family enzyme/predicted kinase